ncbi:MAG: DapH/DapD/GlmU-related protein [Chloroflexota bacterium]
MSIAEHREALLGEQPTLHQPVHITDSALGRWTEIGAGTTISESSFGDYSYCAGDVSIIYSRVGKFCSIASHVRLNPGNHPMDRVTQHHLTYRRARFNLAEEDDAAFFDWRRSHTVTVGHDVWLGHGALVMPGVTIGTGAVVAAGAVVTRDVAPYTVVAGVPARVLRPRFDAQIAERIARTEWWNWSHETIRERLADLCDVALFLDKYGG